MEHPAESVCAQKPLQWMARGSRVPNVWAALAWAEWASRCESPRGRKGQGHVLGGHELPTTAGAEVGAMWGTTARHPERILQVSWPGGSR